MLPAISIKQRKHPLELASIIFIFLSATASISADDICDAWLSPINNIFFLPGTSVKQATLYRERHYCNICNKHAEERRI
ncbi:MAG: hypothetical protein EOP47_28485 [Sphingobacteriaceae bacterium]|nr:MAG: hypothetical protein EOP47_28485 [Sphingobacteriaceae bacterium]